MKGLVVSVDERIYEDRRLMNHFIVAKVFIPEKRMIGIDVDKSLLELYGSNDGGE